MTPGEYVMKMTAAKEAANRVLPVALTACAKYTAGIIESDTPDRLRGLGGKGRLGVYVLKPKKVGNRASSGVRAKGQFHLIEHPIRPHVIIPRSVGRIRGRRGSERNRQAMQDRYDALFGSGVSGHALKIGDSYRPRVQHPGVSRSSGPFAQGVLRAAPMIPRILGESVWASIRTIL